MSKQQFRIKVGLNKHNLAMLDIINSVIEEYAAADYILTLRQLYYQLVSRDIIPNRTQEYVKLSTTLVKGRMAGIVDWSAIEDRTRKPFLPYYVNGVADAINDTIEQYRLNRQEGQHNYIEVFIEKDALSGVVKRITSKYHIHLITNRGYSSATALYDAYKRLYQASHQNQHCHILYLGDYDPSGLDMIRDVTERLHEFGVFPKIHHLALTEALIRKYNPPPNPAKISDPRAKWYIKEHGQTSWEVDALRPDILSNIIDTSIKKLIDQNLFDSIMQKETFDKTKLSQIYSENF
jgi:hypothetical protein